MTATATSPGLRRFHDFPTAGTRLHAVPQGLCRSIPAKVGDLSLASSSAAIDTLRDLGAILAEVLSDLGPSLTCQLYYDFTKAAEAAQLERRTFSPPQQGDYWWLPPDMSHEDFSLESPEWLSEVVGDLQERGFRRRNDPRTRY